MRLSENGYRIHFEQIQSEQIYQEGTVIQIQLNMNVIYFFLDGKKVASVDLIECGLIADQLKDIEWHPFIEAANPDLNCSFSIQTPVKSLQ